MESLPEYLKLPDNENPQAFAKRIIEIANMHPHYGWAFYLRMAGEVITKLIGNDPGVLEEWQKANGKPQKEARPRAPSPTSFKMTQGAHWRIFKDPMPENLPIEVKSSSGAIHLSNSRSYDAEWWIKQGCLGWRPDPVGQHVSQSQPYADIVKDAKPKLGGGKPRLEAPEPAAKPRLAKPQLSGLLEGQKPSSKPRLGEPPAAPEKPSKPKIQAPRRSLFD